ncbi:MAG: OmpA family protein [Phycisphaerae bacterium]|nr:OmpA family protein [Phycisphaerae bacterium]
MRAIKLTAVIVAIASLVLVNGCVPEQDYKDLKIQNTTQQKRINELESQIQAIKLELDQCRRQLETAQGRGGAEAQAMQQKIAALEEDLAKKTELIRAMQQQLIYGGAQLPAELSTMLEEFAAGKDLVEYDAARGIVKFKSDLLFEKGSAVVESSAAEAVRALAGILNSEEGKNFDIIIAGHTDDIRIAKPETRAQHPTNWHLSAHRAISVLDVMESAGLTPERMSVRGFGQFRPLEENQPNQKGNPVNRRVEIYIVPKGA